MKTFFRSDHEVLIIALFIYFMGISFWPAPLPVSEKPDLSNHTPIETGNLPDKTKTDIMEVIARREYDITDQQGTLQSPNRKQQLRASYKPGVLKIEERISGVKSGQKFLDLEIENKGIYADKKLLYIPEKQASIKKNENHLVIRHNGFSEEYINNENGIRQNFIIDQAPENTKNITVDLKVSGFTITDAGKNAVTFTNNHQDENSTLVLTYSDLKCWDADGKILTASLHGSGGTMQINLEVVDARFPVTIDPIIANGTPSNASRVMEINQTSAWLGYSVASAGDVNGDGYSEVLVGAPKYDAGEVDEGAAFLFPGTANGLSLAAKILQSNEAGAQAGTSVSSAGDLNDDGYSEILVGAPYYGGTDAGAVLVYYGSISGVNPAIAYKLHGSQSNANFGISVATVGDVDGNGMSDFVVGAHLYDNGQTNEGAAFLYYGTFVFFDHPIPVVLEANQANALMGYSVGAAGDIDGDGFNDVMVGARLYSNGETYEGAVFVYRGSSSGIITTNPQRIEGNQVDARLGHAIAPAGDVNGDGYGDVILGAYLYDKGQTNEGAAMIYHGSSSGLNPTPATTLEKDQTEAWFGWAVSAAGDVNGDGYADVLVGSRYYDNGQNNEGAAFVYHGSATGVITTPASTIESNQSEAWLGYAVAPAGDVNGDGYSDIVVGSYAFDSGQTDEGIALVFNGSASGVGTKDAVLVNYPNEMGTMGKSLDCAGDVNGDGFDDIIVGVPHADVLYGIGNVYIFYGSLNGINTNSPYVLTQEQQYYAYGNSVSGAGDVNGDGYDDVVVGSFTYNGPPDVGTVYVYYGSATGIDQAVKGTVTTNAGGSGFGFAVDGGGDINGDGYADIVVGAPNQAVSDVTYGAAYVFYGSALGIGTSPKTIIGPEANAQFGVRVAMAGNVNGDNYDDLLIAQQSSDNSGKVFVHHGSSTGLEDNPAITLSGNMPSLRIGMGISRAGDVNGDGFGDILIGAPVYNTNQAAVLVHYGSGSGITANNRAVVTSTVTGFGEGIASAGDVNGDGYSDIIVGAPNYKDPAPGAPQAVGAAYTFHGSVSGISLVPTFTSIGAASVERRGEAVAGAGDVNGDGYSDVLVGSPSFSHQSAVMSGRFQLFYGNNGKSLRNDLRIYNADLVNFYNQNYPNQNSVTSFGVGLFAKSFLGVCWGKLVIETRAPGSSFSRIVPYPITTSTDTQPGIISVSDNILPLLGKELKTPLVEKRSPSTYVRVRLMYHPSKSITGQRYGPWRYLPDHVRGASIAPPPQPVTSEVLQPVSSLRKVYETVAVYPNPVSEQIIVRSNAADIQSLELISSDGKPVRKSLSGQREMNVKGLPPGSYLLIIRETGKTSSHRIVVR